MHSIGGLVQLSIQDAIFELVKTASTTLPPDVTKALANALKKEEKGGTADVAFVSMLKNAELAREKQTPMCQDTGWPTFFVNHPIGWSTNRMRREIDAAVAKATNKTILRPNAVNPLTGVNTGTCVGTGIPTIYFQEWEKDTLKVDLLLKGGGSENVSTQFKLPNPSMGAGRDLDGIRKVVLKAINDAQGMGCSPGIVGIGIGGDRALSFKLAKKQLLRKLPDINPDGELARFEDTIVSQANSLGIGPMGFGGKTTLLGAKVGVASRHPASFFVSVAYFCWGSRRASFDFMQNGKYTISQ